MHHKILVEIIVTTARDVRELDTSLVDRLELIRAFGMGGLSAELDVSKSVCDISTVPVNVMVRPHGRSFVYNEADMQQIISEIIYLRDHTKANGVVFGSLDTNDTIDEVQLQEVIDNLGHLELTFHRAIDESRDFVVSFTTLSKYSQVKTVLTSGNYPSVVDGMNNIKQIQKLNSHINILIGSGITLDNIDNLITELNPFEIHLGSGIRTDGEIDNNKLQQLQYIINKRQNAK